MTTLDHELRTLLADDPQLEALTERAQQRVDATRLTRLTLTKRHRPRVRRASVIVAFGAFLIVGGVALAASQGVFTKPPAVGIERAVPELRNGAATPISAKEAQSLTQLTTGFDGDQPAGTAWFSNLMPVDQGVVLVDDPTNGRIAALGSSDGHICFTYSFDATVLSSACTDRLGPNGISVSYGHGDTGGNAYGLADPSVTAISYQTRDGRWSDATMQHDAYVWHATGSDDGSFPKLIRITRDGVTRTMNVMQLN